MQEVGVAAARSPQTATKCLFFLFLFLKISSYSNLPSKQVTGFSHSPTLQPDQGLTRSGSVTAQLFPACIHSLGRCTLPLCVCHFVLIICCDFKHPGPSWLCSNLVWQGRKPLTWLSPKNPAAGPVGTGPGTAATLVLVLVLGTLLS